MIFEVDQKGTVAVVSLRGDFTEEHVADWRKAMELQLAERVRDFLLDCEELSLVDSKGLEALTWLRESCVDRLGQVRLVGCSEDLKAVLAMTRLDVVFESHGDVAEAIEGLKC